MLDIRYVRENLDAVAENLGNQNFRWDSEKFVELDEQRRSAIAQEEELQASRNKLTKDISGLMRDGKKEEAEAVKAQVRDINERLAEASALRERVDG